VHDVDPIELVIFLSALCCRVGFPYIIVEGKARGYCCHQGVSSEDDSELATIISAAKVETVGEKPKVSNEVSQVTESS